MSTPTKFLPVDWSLTDEESKEQGRITPSQERAILLSLGEIGRSNGSLVGDEPGFGKTAIGAEVIIRAGWTRALIVGLPDTHKQWAERVSLQSDGAIQVRIMNGTAKGRVEFEAFQRGEDGIFVAGSHFLVAQDWESQRVPDLERPGKFVFKRVKKDDLAKGLHKGELILKERAEGAIGPALEPIFVTKSHRKNVFRRTSRKPLEGVIFDECQLIANKSSAGRQTMLSIKSDFRLAMSGTWFLNKVENMWSVARWVWPGEDPATGEPYVESSFARWSDRFLTRETVYGKRGRALETPGGRTITKVTGERVEGEFASTLPAYIRREAEPVPDPEVVYCDPSPEQAAQFEELQRDLMTWVMDWKGEEAPLVVDMPPILHMRLRQAAIAELSFGEDGEVVFADDAVSAKLAPLRGLIEHYGDKPVAIYTDSKLGAHFIAKRMQRAGVDARAWTGDLSRPRREEMKQAFLRGEFRYIVSTVQSFGTGLDGFQRVCNKVIWISEADGNPALNDQAIRRFWRPGGTDKWGGFQHVKLLMRNSVDVLTFEGLIEKAWRMRAAMNGGMAA